MTNDEAAFLAAIVERPDDDLPRLVFADWLEEHGQSERAEFIRVQCELAALPEDCCSGTVAHRPWCTSPFVAIDDLAFARREALRRRERELLKGATKFDCGITERTVDDMDGLYWLPGWPLPPTDARWKFRRGFVEEVTTPWSYDRVAALRKVTPLRRCVLTDWPVMHTWAADDVDHSLVGGVARLARRDGEDLSQIRLRLLAAEFPGTEFELPPRPWGIDVWLVPNPRRGPATAGMP